MPDFAIISPKLGIAEDMPTVLLSEAFLAKGVTPKGFKQSLRYRSQELPERSKELGVQLFHDAAANKLRR
jgi:hypothetical protein